MPRQLSPQQSACWDYYVNPKSETFGNMKGSAIRAGYGEAYAEEISQQIWFQDKLRLHNIRKKGEKVLEEMLDLPVQVETVLSVKTDGENVTTERVTVVKTDPALVRIKQDTAKFAVERLGKDEWSTRQEHTGADGAPLVDLEKKAKSDALLHEFLNSQNSGE